MLTDRSNVLLFALATLALSASCAATGSGECFVGANTAFEADAAGKRCCESPDGSWSACPEQMTGSTTSGIGTSTSPTTTTDWTSTTTDWTTTSTTTTNTGTSSTTDPVSTTLTTSSSTSLDTDTSNTTARQPVCGDGVKEGDEVCDLDCDENIELPEDLKNCIAESNCLLDCKWEENKISCSDDSCTVTAQCGDGVVNAPAGEKEECDDGGLENFDGCSEVCTKEWVMFVTSGTYNGNLEGIEGANQRCVESVDGAGGNVKFDGTYIAWLSIKNQSARYKLPKGKTLIDTMGNPIMDTSDFLETGTIYNGIGFDENGESVSGFVWTGTSATGYWKDSHCNGWKLAEGFVTAYAGIVGDPGTAWSFYEEKWCGGDLHLYCFRADE